MPLKCYVAGCMEEILALGRQMQEDCQDLKVPLGYVVNSRAAGHTMFQSLTPSSLLPAVLSVSLMGRTDTQTFQSLLSKEGHAVYCA